MAASPNIVLVHGAWADGSCWSSVIERMQSDGYHVAALVYIAAFGLDEGESIGALLPPGGDVRADSVRGEGRRAPVEPLPGVAPGLPSWPGRPGTGVG